MHGVDGKAVGSKVLLGTAWPDGASSNGPTSLPTRKSTRNDVLIPANLLKIMPPLCPR